ncbi:MAG: CHASE domain-containing protein [Phycisphaerales bacterium]|nr:CHASE domain-containing protein [Phycisphaerales bacterium]
MRTPKHSGGREGALRRWGIPIVLVAVAVGGGVLVEQRVTQLDEDRRAVLLYQAEALARTINPEFARALTFGPDDLTNPVYERFCEQMASYRALLGYRGIWTLAERDGELVFGPESYPRDDPHASAPGTIYQQPSREVRAIFRTGCGFTEGPFADEYGDFVSAIASVRDPDCGKILLAVGIDVEAAGWAAVLWRERLGGLVCVFALLAILAMGGLVLRWREALVVDQRRWLRYTEAYLTVILGLGLTVLAAANSHRAEKRARGAQFVQLADTHNERVLDTFFKLREFQLDSVVRFIENSESVEFDEFRSFCARLARHHGLRAIAYAERVAVEDRSTFEAWARTAGRSNYRIWQHDGDGRQKPAQGRAVLYPVWLVEPAGSNDAVLGFDLGSESLRRTALEAALRTGLVTATDPVKFVHEPDDGFGSLIFQPVFHQGDRAGDITGFAVVALRLGALLQALPSANAPEDSPVIIDLYQLWPDGSQRLLGTTRGQPSHESAWTDEAALPRARARFTVGQPLFAFGKTYAVVVTPGPAFLAAQPARAASLTAGVGLLLTGVFAAFAVFLIRRRTDLETEVRVRTTELWDSEARFRTLIEGSADAHLLLRNERFVQCNDAAVRMLHLKSAEQLLHCHPAELSPPQQPDGRCSREKSEEIIAAALRGGCQRFEWVHRRADGEDFFVEVLLTAIADREGALLHAVCREITERKQAEAALRASEVRLRAIGDNLPDGAVYQLEWECAGQVRFVHASEGLARLLECSLDDILDGRVLISTRLIPEDRERYLALSADAIRTLSQFDGEFRLLRKDGCVRWIHCRSQPERLPDGRVVAAGVAMDVTARKASQEAVAEKEHWIRSLVTNMQDLVFVLDRELAFKEYFQPPSDLLCMEPASFVGRTVDQVALPEPARERIKAALTAVLRSGEVSEAEYYLDLPAGRTWFELRASGLRDVHGIVQDVICVARNITARKCAEDKLLAANRDLAEATAHAGAMATAAEQASRAKSEFLANMSHEIRTPMTAILGFAEAAIESCPHEQRDLRANLETILRNGGHLLGLLNDILDLSKIEAGRLKVEQIACAPLQIIAEVASMMRARSVAKGVELDIAFDGPIPASIQSDPIRLRQVLINVLGNAVKFTEQGTVRMVIRLTDQHSAGTALEFDIIDTGLGMTAEAVAHIFQPFSQADASMTRRFGGTGLGLTISRRLAQALGGDVLLLSTSVGRGSHFRVRVATGLLEGVPLLTAPSEALQTSFSAPSETITADGPLVARVLLAEDGPDNQRLIRYLLHKAGAEVTVVENGELAVEAALCARQDGRPFDVILMDMQMPVLDGYTATTQLRSRGYSGTIIALTAHAMAGDREKCLAAGCDDYATKPIQRAALLKLLRRYTGAVLMSP